MTLSSQSNTDLKKNSGTPYDNAVRSGPAPARAPRSFAELEKEPPTRGRCTRCKQPATVRVAVTVRPAANPGGNGVPKAIAKHLENMCEPCAVGIYLGATR